MQELPSTVQLQLLDDPERKKAKFIGTISPNLPPVEPSTYSSWQRLIMNEIHQKVGHAGCERTLWESRRQYWILNGRRLAKKLINECTVCRKLRQPPHHTLMGDLPPERIKPFSPPFTVTGVDLFGPFSLKVSRNQVHQSMGSNLHLCNSSSNPPENSRESISRSLPSSHETFRDPSRMAKHRNF